MKIDRHVGGMLRSFRRDQCLSQHDFALLLGVSVEELAAYEEGERPLPLSVALLASLMLNCTVESLLEDIVFDNFDDL